MDCSWDKKNFDVFVDEVLPGQSMFVAYCLLHVEQVGKTSFALFLSNNINVEKIT